MTKLESLRHLVGTQGNWDKYGTCSLPYAKHESGFIETYLICESGKKDVHISNFPDITDIQETLSEVQAKIVIERFVKPRDVDGAVTE